MPNPKQVSIEITNNCNARCRSCIRRFSQRPIVNMELPIIDKILQEVSTLGLTENVGICGIGEPMLHPEFDEIAKRLKPFNWSLSTNGQVLGQHIDAIIENRPKEVVISIDAACKETHEQVRCGLNFDTVVQNTQLFLGRIKELVTPNPSMVFPPPPFWDAIYIQFIINKITYKEVNEFIDFWLPQIKDIPNVYIFMKPICPWPEHRANDLWGEVFPLERKLNLTKGELKNVVEHLKIAAIDEVVKFRDSCVITESFIIILSDGTASVCCLNSDDVFGIGNIQNNSLVELFNNEVSNLLRERIKKKEYDSIPFCKNCV